MFSIHLVTILWHIHCEVVYSMLTLDFVVDNIVWNEKCLSSSSDGFCM